jgi:hypothetical protein
MPKEAKTLKFMNWAVFLGHFASQKLSEEGHVKSGAPSLSLAAGLRTQSISTSLSFHRTISTTTHPHHPIWYARPIPTVEDTANSDP